MKILLVNPPITNRVKSSVSGFIDSFSSENPMPPLGLMYIASYVKRCTEHDVQICDMVVGDPLLAILMKYKPDVVGITTTTLTLYDALQVAKMVKEYSKNIVTVIGGAHCDIYPYETASFKEFDYVIRGEGELPFLRVLRGHDSKILDVEIIENIDSKPFPDRTLIDITKYHGTLARKPVTSTVTGAGCSYSCSFCYQPHYSKHWRARSASNVVEEMYLIQRMGIGEIEIMDDTFTTDKQRVMDICDSLVFHKANASWSVDWNIRTRVDKVDLQMLQKMKLAGCKRINYGIESYNPEVLKTLRKGFHVEQIEQTMRWTKEVGIEVQAYFMLGSPYETFEQMRQTIDYAKKAKPDYAYFSLTSPMPGTAMYKWGLDEGRYTDYWRAYALNPTADFTMNFWRQEVRQEMIELLEYAYKSFYFRPDYILGQLLKVRSMDELTRKAKMALGMAK